MTQENPVSLEQIDDCEFRRMWEDGMRVVDMAQHYGCAVSSVNRKAKRMGLASRYPQKPQPETPKRRKAADVIAEAPGEEERMAAAIDALPDRERWPREVDVAIIEAGRCYAEQAKVERRFGLPCGAAWRRWVRINPIVSK